MNELLKYNNPAKVWNEALPMGNGHIGAMVFGKGREEVISLNECTLWSGYPMDKTRKGAYKAYEKAVDETMQGNFAEAQKILSEEFISLDTDRYLPLGDLNIRFHHEGETGDYCRSLDLSCAVQRINYTCDNVNYSREIFVSFPHRVLVIKLTADKEGKIGFDLSLSSQLRNCTQVKGDKYILSGICPTQSQTNSKELVYSDKDCEKGMTFSTVCSVKTNGGTKKITPGGICVQDADEAVIYLTAVTSYNGFDKHPYTEGKEHLNKSIETIGEAERVPYTELLNSHIKYYQSFYKRCDFLLQAESCDHIPTDKRLHNPDIGLFVLMYNFGKYLLISSSTPDGTATNLQGIWNHKLSPPWKSNYTVNINTQMNYWPALGCFMPELTKPLDDLIYKIYVNGSRTAKEHYNTIGFVCHHNTDIWGHSVPVAKGGDAYVCTYAYWNMSSGWLCRHLFEKYRYTADREYLESFAYPIMKAATMFYKSLLVTYGGKLIFPMSTSPENTFNINGGEAAVAKYTTMSQSIIYELFQNTLTAAEILKCDEEFRLQLQEILPRLSLFKVGSKGQLLEWDEEYEEHDLHHRHVSHLYALYPANLIKYTDIHLADACRKTLELRGDEGTGWSLSWKLAFHARLRDSEKALRLLKMQLRPVESHIDDWNHPGGTYPNMFDAHPPFQIDGNFGIMAGINEMLCQFEDSKITLLPATPKEWHSGKFENLHGPGGICVSVCWKEGKITEYIIKIKDKKLHNEGELPFGTEINLL